MRKTLTIAMLIFTLLMGGCMAVPAQAAVISVEVDGGKVIFPDQQPYADANSRVLVPIRFPMEALGVTAEWNQSKQQAILTKGSTTAIFTLGSNNYTVNGLTMTMDTVPIAENGRTLFPIRFAAEAFGATVSWDQASMTARIKSGQVDQVPLPIVLQYPADKAKLYNANLLYFATGDKIQGIKAQCVNNDLINQTINGRRDQRYNGLYAVCSHKCYGPDASYQVQPGEVLIFDVWVEYFGPGYQVLYGLALDDYTWTVPDYR